MVISILLFQDTPELNSYLVPFYNEKILILKRKNEFWEFPGGGVEFGEHPETTAARETLEETGLRVKNILLLGITSAVYLKDGKKKHSVYIVYKGEADGYEFKITEEHKEGRWITVGELEFVNLALNAKDVVDFLKYHY
ncbi:MAG: NUDIX domain-containing protein [Candidatus Micrarchaeota archaeon]